MPVSVLLKIDVTKIDKAHLFQGKKGNYLDAALHDKKNDFGDDGFITQGVSKEARERGEKGPIIGNWRFLTGSKPQIADAVTPSAPAADDPFGEGAPF